MTKVQIKRLITRFEFQKIKIKNYDRKTRAATIVYSYCSNCNITCARKMGERRNIKL